MNNSNITRKKKKRAWLGLGREKINLTDVLERLLELPNESIQVYDINDKTYKMMIDSEQKKKDAHDARRLMNQNKKPMNQDGTSVNQDGTSVNQDGTSVNQDGTSVNQDGTSVNQDGTSVNQDGTSVNQDGSNKEDAESTEQVPRKFNFDSAINSNDQTVIKGLMNELNTILRLPELNLFSNKVKEDGEDGIVTIVETTINEADGSEKQGVEKLMIPPNIVIPGI